MDERAILYLRCIGFTNTLDEIAEEFRKLEVAHMVVLRANGAGHYCIFFPMFLTEDLETTFTLSGKKIVQKWLSKKNIQFYPITESDAKTINTILSSYNEKQALSRQIPQFLKNHEKSYDVLFVREGEWLSGTVDETSKPKEERQ